MPPDATAAATDDAANGSPPPLDQFRQWRTEVYTQIKGLGNLPMVLIIFFPRAALSFAIVLLAQLCRALARLLASTSSYETKANLRILIVTDYMPPQTHGIAVRFQQYIETMRKEGHEVQVFSTNLVKERETSFDHPNLPSIQNPFNKANLMAYNPGVKLAWYLGAKQWDLVHLVYPTNIGVAILPACNWRRIPVYCSHHVDMEYYIGQYVRMGFIIRFGHFIYWLMVKMPAIVCANVNAAPTLCFLNSHIPKCPGARVRIPSGVADARFRIDSPAQLVQERQELLQRIGADPSGEYCVLLMVQRLAPEKDSNHLLEALHALRQRSLAKAAGGRSANGRPAPSFSLDGKRSLHLVIAGDGPARKSLESYVSQHALPVTFLGNLKNDRLPPLYRAADLFVTCSTSETYGLTVLEALACGTPVVIPRCPVFDELWLERLPAGWLYNHKDVDALLEALATAGTGEAKRYLAENPIKASWRDATLELLEQYKQAIAANMPYRKELATYTRAFNHLLRVALVAAVFWLLMRAEFKLIRRLVVRLGLL